MTSPADKEKAEALLKQMVADFDRRWENPQHNNASLDAFDRIRTLGTGAFGRVMLVKHTESQAYYAMKILDKFKIFKLKQIEHVVNEKNILQAMSYPFIVKLDFSFQDNSNLYIVLEFVGGGELFTYLRKLGHLTEPHSKLYACQMILAFEYLQAMDIIYRDLKPENILIAPSGNLKMTDFGFAKKIKGRTYTLCGTPEYIAPEIIQNRGYGFAADWWSMGILIYELNAGHPPFYANDHLGIYDKILTGKLKFPPSFSSDLKDLLRNLIQRDLTRRYGNLVSGIGDIKGHTWFNDINWLAVLECKIPPLYIPPSKGAGDSSNFDQYTEEPIKILSKDKYANEFKNF